MTARLIEVFFYGLFMDIELLRGQAVVPRHAWRAFIEGFTLRIGQRATLIPMMGTRAYGMLPVLAVHCGSRPRVSRCVPSSSDAQRPSLQP